MAQTRSPVIYDGSYRRIAYPGGDVPESIGVCTDLIIRAYRRVGVDLQVEVHEDMKRGFGAYPQLWGMSRPDPNIDHRRVPNLQTFFRRAAERCHVSQPSLSAQVAAAERALGLRLFERDRRRVLGSAASISTGG